MKKYLLPIVLTVPLVLTACGKEDEPVATPSPLAVETTSEAPSGPVEVELGETINLTQDANGERDIDLTIEDISISDQCHAGLNSYTDTPAEPGYYIQMLGEVEVKQSTSGYSFIETSITALDDNDYIIEIAPAFNCNQPQEGMDDYQSFNNPVSEGQKARGVLEFWVADIPDKLSFTEPYEPLTWLWDVPEIESYTPQEESHAEQPGAVQESPAQPAPVEQVQPEVTSTCATDFTMYQPGTTLYSDGSTGYTPECQRQMEQLMQDSGQFPDYPYGEF